MVREDFDDSFERLREQSNRLAATARTGENLDEIVEERVELDRLRHEATEERKRIVSRFEPPAPDVVKPPRGYVNTRSFGKIMAAVCVILLVVAGYFAVKLVRDFVAEFPLEYVDIDESMDAETCQWTVRATLRNDSDQTVRVMQMMTVLNRRSAGAMATSYPTLEPGDTAVATGVWTLRNVEVCPAVTDVNHGNLRMRLDNDSTVSRGF